jgi:hypothetical protein
MSKGKNFKSDNFILSLRLKGAEALRFWSVLDVAKGRDPYAERTDVIRELLGLEELRLLTEEDLSFFRTGRKTQDPKATKTQESLIKNGEVLQEDGELFVEFSEEEVLQLLVEEEKLHHKN